MSTPADSHTEDHPAPRAVLVGCGDVGTRIGHRLRDRGFSVTGWRRSPERLPAEFDGAAMDLTEPDSVPLPPADTAALVFSPAAGSRDPQRYEQVYLQGLRTVLDRLEHSGLADSVRVLLVSSTSAMGDAEGMLDESAPLTPASPTGEILARTEELLSAWRAEGTDASARRHSSTLRLSGIYGPGRDRIRKQLRAGSVGEAAGQDTHDAWRISNRIHSDDAARAAVELLTRASPPELVLGVDELPIPVGVVHNWMADQLELPRPWGDPRLDPALLESSRSVDLLAPGHGKALDGSRLHGLLGELLHRDFRSGYAAMLGD
ncbi:NAD-dependent epimerase/dehydratase family protein [Nesterenkonia halotolerans]|uniref:Nucleoside-diphosphate-sugar epimerase n=1 Tax=Nesterenkonia halotolerans TaxID=225325 RepID=A0ABR9J7F3_9MICC|nr:NAD-dependent epimerase/dehydratase family protein [Nesterenkonia halotolerans]MBE1514511.1 nucleoside-diphosphate-sugar epimerase [Nesterenkonia halotolerans]